MKVLNVFAIILAWILSIAMVIMLIAAPLAMSALSLLDAETIADVVSEAILENNKSTATQSQNAYAVQTLSAETEETTEEMPVTDGALDGLNPEGLQGIMGEQIDEEVLNKILQSDAVGELLNAYIADVTNAITGKPGEKQFTAEKLVEVVEDNIDEIVEMVEESGETLSDDEKVQLKIAIQSAVEENAEQIIAEVPAPEEIKETLIDENKGLEIAFGILAAKNQIKGAIVGIIVLLSVLIFALRYPRFRGLRWLYTNLFTAVGFNVVICLILGFGTSAIKGITAGVNAVEGTAVDGIVGTLVSQLTMGVIIRTAIMFVAAIALLVAYIMLKIFVRKRRAKKEIPLMEETVSEPAPAPIPEVAHAAPVYTDVTIEPELAVEPAEVAEDVTVEAPAEEPNPAEQEDQ